MTTAAEVLEALQHHWPDQSHLCIPEAPQDVMRQGRKIDLLVCSFWKSRGYSLDAVEVKVTVQDWMREVNQPAKADFWYQHSDRFWVAVPSAMTARVLDTLPDTWGLLGVSDGKVGTVRAAPKHSRTELPWSAVLGIIRCASAAGANALMRAEERGREEGYRRGQRNAAAGVTQAHLEEMRGKVAEFQAATGIDLADNRWRTPFGKHSGAEIGKAVQRLLESDDALTQADQSLEHVLGQLRNAQRAVERVRAGEAGP